MTRLTVSGNGNTEYDSVSSDTRTGGCCGYAASIGKKISTTKKLSAEDLMATPLRRCLNTFDITFLGVGHMVGAGIYVATGTVIRQMAGPATLISFILAGIASLLAAFCYAEFGARVPKAGSAYVYTYVTMGEILAFIIGWDVSLEYLIGAASVSKSWSGTVNSLVNGAIVNGTIEYVGHVNNSGIPFISNHLDFVAVGVIFIGTAIIMTGAKGSANFNSTFTIVNLCVIVLVSVLGFVYAQTANWSPFLPFGFAGVMTGAARVFFAYVGFDSIAVCSEEAKNPSFAIPTATMVSLSLVTVCYVAFTAALTLVVPYSEMNISAPAAEAFHTRGIEWARYVISAGSLCGMSTTMFGNLYSITRTLYAMSSDGLLFKFLSYVERRTQVPIFTAILCAVLCAIIALLMDLDVLVDLTSIGALMAYTLVSASVLLLRYRPPIINVENETSTIIPGQLKSSWNFLYPIVGRYPPGQAATFCVVGFVASCAGLLPMVTHGFWTIEELDWWGILILIVLLILTIGFLVMLCAFEQSTLGLKFTCPLVPLVPGLSIFCNIGLMTYLDRNTWMRFVVWMAIGLVIYFSYGIRYSKNNKHKTTALASETNTVEMIAVNNTEEKLF